jgi:hypothetical protein
VCGTGTLFVVQKEIMSSLQAAALIDVSVARAKLGDMMQAVVPEVRPPIIPLRCSPLSDFILRVELLVYVAASPLWVACRCRARG